MHRGKYRPGDLLAGDYRYAAEGSRPGTVQAKLANKDVSVPKIEAQESAVQDLMEQLRKSLEMTG